MTAPPIIRAPRCAVCAIRLIVTRTDWRRRDRAGAIAAALERQGWDTGPRPRCLPCGNIGRAAYHSKGATS